MLETEDGTLRLSPAYDIVRSKLVIPNELDSALVINGKQNKITRSDFLSFSDCLDIPQKVRDHILEKMRAILEIANPDISDSYIPDEDREKMIRIIEERWTRIYE